ncbi:MAG: NMD3-related protein [Candidatus Nanoarchaeia archaeon]
MEIFAEYKDIEIVYCKSCWKFYYRQRLLPLKEFKKVFDKYIKEHIRFCVEPEEFYTEEGFFELFNDPPKSAELAIKAVNGEYSDEVSVPVKFKAIECPVCSRLRGGYYEGVLQLRNTHNDMFEKCHGEIEQTIESKDLVAISNKKKVKGGIDFFITDKKTIKSLANFLHKKYGGELKLSPELYSEDRQSSKKIYRLSALLRLPDFNINDIVSHKGEYYRIVSFSSAKATGISLKACKNKTLELLECTKVAQKEDIKEAIVTKKKPSVEVLHPETFESTKLENEPPTEKDKIDVVIIKEKIYAV